MRPLTEEVGGYCAAQIKDWRPPLPCNLNMHAITRLLGDQDGL
jgi:hypothetical protein